jgi:hypothetical protein
MADEDISSKLWIIGAALSLLLVFLGYIFSRKTNVYNTSNREDGL